MPSIALVSARLESALRFTAIAHRDQVRKASTVPYVQHVFAVAIIIDRLEFAEDVVIAALLHDVIEDTDLTSDDVEHAFGCGVRDLVVACTEQKRDINGNAIPWHARKTEHLARLAQAPLEAKAIVLADKLHNLLSIRHDLAAGERIWDRFSAPRSLWILTYRNAIDTLAGSALGDPRIERLAEECRSAVLAIEAWDAR